MIERISSDPFPDTLKLVLLIIRPTHQPIWANSSLGKLNTWVRIPGNILFINNNDEFRDYVKVVSDNPSNFQIAITKLETYFQEHNMQDSVGVYYNMNMDMPVEEWRTYRTILAKSNITFIITENVDN